MGCELWPLSLVKSKTRGMIVIHKAVQHLSGCNHSPNFQAICDSAIEEGKLCNQCSVCISLCEITWTLCILRFVVWLDAALPMGYPDHSVIEVRWGGIVFHKAAPYPESCNNSLTLRAMCDSARVEGRLCNQCSVLVSFYQVIWMILCYFGFVVWFDPSLPKRCELLPWSLSHWE